MNSGLAEPLIAAVIVLGTCALAHFACTTRTGGQVGPTISRRDWTCTLPPLPEGQRWFVWWNIGFVHVEIQRRDGRKWVAVSDCLEYESTKASGLLWAAEWALRKAGSRQ